HTSTTSAANAQTTLSGFTAALLAALQQLVSHDPFGATPLIGPTLWWSIAGPVGPPNLATRIVTVAQAAASRLAEAELESAPASWAGPGLTPAILAGAQSPSLSGGPAGVSAGWGQAGSIGGLSVPRSWIAATPAISPAAAVAQPANIGAAAAVTGTPWHEMALAHLPAVQQ
ncbi:PE/PPE C-terminal domain-containing protein, partial [Mycobacterium sp.]|uniref:PE/PPE C-terminal domain-containing protein n=1 Tax=Mycobacterium sp. TaxID=1785 RepID=UPI0012819350